MIGSAEVARCVARRGAPVLCLDTCALLDIMRDPTRDQFCGGHAAAALHLLAHAETNPPTLSIVVAQQVVDEIADQMDKVQREAEGAIQRLDTTFNRAYGVLAAHGLVSSATPPALSQFNFPARARAIVERFVDVSHLIAEDNDIVARAWDRVRACVAPATRAKQSIKDCVIIETYFQAARALRAAGFSGKLMFLTTNTSDFTEGTRARLHPDLQVDFETCAMAFAANFLAVRYGLREARRI